MKTEKKTLPLTAVLIQDPVNNSYTGFFEEFPQAVAEGDTEDELMDNLLCALTVLAKMNKEDFDNDVPQPIAGNLRVSKRHLELEIA